MSRWGRSHSVKYLDVPHRSRLSTAFKVSLVPASTPRKSLAESLVFGSGSWRGTLYGPLHKGVTSMEFRSGTWCRNLPHPHHSTGWEARRGTAVPFPRLWLMYSCVMGVSLRMASGNLGVETAHFPMLSIMHSRIACVKKTSNVFSTWQRNMPGKSYEILWNSIWMN